jgi:hypothetical protein
MMHMRLTNNVVMSRQLWMQGRNELAETRLEMVY